ncbi:hypothetical protein [Algoriphagus resistens]|uniref:hypothetical protein n=1 Tax=Algoriphagus resistens TaxID=1750590 RepID=UPI0007169DB9|nr:hypothetical protein [Algoriphagus resistens]
MKVHCGEFNRQPLAQGKGVHRGVESEGSRRQNSALRNTNLIRHILWDEAASKVEVQRLYGHRSVNEAGTWSESGLSYHGRPHGRVETRGKTSREESAEGEAPDHGLFWEGPNLAVWQ